MEEKKTVFDYFAELMTTYGVMVMVFLILNLLIGKKIGDFSSLFRLGGEGIGLDTLLQLFLLAAVITVARIVFLTDRLIKSMPILLRNAIFFILILLTMAVMVIAFHWFPLTEIRAWIGFGISYTISMLASLFLIRAEERAENKKLQEALERFNR
ncbi:MAG: hypothetical protein K6E50_07335 [Lachnospiraceae bacterium]|nr:hypothetical protein [Lachnospiraceae bacterium]